MLVGMRRYSNPDRVRLWSRMVYVTWGLMGLVAMVLVVIMLTAPDCSDTPNPHFELQRNALLTSAAVFVLSGIVTGLLGFSMRCDICQRRFAVELGPGHEDAPGLHWQHVAIHALRYSWFTCRYCASSFSV